MKSATFACMMGCLVLASLATGRARAESHLVISGIYPHLATYNQPADVDDRPNHGECGIGAIVPWAGRLWYLTYPQHKTTGSSDKLYEVDAELNRTIRPESVGGTHACRMIHRESNQLIIGPYFIDAQGNVRSADLQKLRGRMTTVMQHLVDPANKVYFFDMEGAIYEVDVHTLAVNRLFTKPVPGWHGKGGYTAQGRVVIANNGERDGAGLKDVLVGGPPVGEEAGVLAEWDGTTWRIVERKQFLDVTGPGGIHGSPSDKAPLWAIGWDKQSVILKLLDGGRWSTFRMPKASHTFDPRHGWYTEWPRIREIAAGRPMMCMHGGLFDFPVAFSARNTSGIRPISTHLRYIPDFCHWQDRMILGADDASMMANPMCGQAQSNLWFGTADELAGFGPRAGWGGPWLDDSVTAGEPSAPFLIAGYRDRCLHLAVGPRREPVPPIARCSDKYSIDNLPEELRDTFRITVARGDYHEPTPGYAFTVDRDVEVYLAVDNRGDPELDDDWEKTQLKLTWDGHTDSVYFKRFAQGRIEIPGHTIPHGSQAYDLPNLSFVRAAAEGPGALRITDLPEELAARVGPPLISEVDKTPVDVALTLEIDRNGDGTWTRYESIDMPISGYAFRVLPDDLDAEWIRVVADKDCQATAYFHYWTPRPAAPGESSIFDSLADADSPGAYTAGLIRPAAHNRSLQWLVEPVSADGTVQASGYREIDLSGTTALSVSSPEESREDEVREVAAVDHDFDVDAASVIVTTRDGRRFRLPKGPAAFDRPFAGGWPRGVRECVSERFLANLHGTFYEIPRADDHQSPDFAKIKPVASHNKLVADFCTWRGLLVISGTKSEEGRVQGSGFGVQDSEVNAPARLLASHDGHFFAAPDGRGLWFGAIDDLWKLGKPVGHGGPWRDTPIRGGETSDPYLMTGYDQKRIELSHDDDSPVTFTVEVDFDHSGFVTYGKFTVPAGRPFEHDFPRGFHAHWVRLASDKSCRATAMLDYE